MWLWCTTHLQCVQAHVHARARTYAADVYGVAPVAPSHREASVLDSYFLKVRMTALCSPSALLSNLPAVCGTHPFINVYHLQRSGVALGRCIKRSFAAEWQHFSTSHGLWRIETHSPKALIKEFIIPDGAQRVQSWSQAPQATVQCLDGPGLNTQFKGLISRYDSRTSR